MTSEAASSKKPATSSQPVARVFDPFAGFLSYLVPGLGQIYQGRIGKGILFLVCVLGMFFYGMSLGSWSNVYLADSADDNNPLDLPRLWANLYNRPQFAGQFWIGVSAWPAVYQYISFDQDQETGPLFGAYQRAPYESKITEGANSNDPAQRTRKRAELRGKKVFEADPQREVTFGRSHALKDWNGRTLNELQREGDKTWDLGWVFTVIAGVLNIMVIYDAMAGPAFVVDPTRKGDA